MKICKFCRKGVKSVQLKKRTILLPIGLPVTSLEPMCDTCYNKLNKNYDNPSRNTNTREVEGTIS